MSLRPLKSFFPTADELLHQELPALGEMLLAHLKSYEGQNTVYQHAGLNRGYFRAMLESRHAGLGTPPPPEYGDKQPEVTKRMMEAWNWLERQGLLIHNDQQVADWFVISSEGEKLLSRNARFERLEKLGLDRVKHDLLNGGFRVVGGTADNQEEAWEWVRMKENKPPRKSTAAGGWLMVAESRLEELKSLTSQEFDFRKLIRLCEELNIASREDCCFAVGMLTRGLLDHVPPIFRLSSFKEVANNYAGGGKSFKESMQHLESGARKIADLHLHGAIRKSETLPAPQQVNFAPYLDVLLSAIVRITR